MNRRTAVLSATVLATAAACSLTTSLSGFSTGDVIVISDGGDERAAAEGGGTSEGGATGEAGSSTYASVVLSDSPFAFYRLGDPGTVARDEVGGHDGTYVGGVAHATGAIAGEPDTAAVFDGSGSYVDVTAGPSFDGQASFTLEAWVSPTSGASTPMCVVAKTYAPGGANGNVADGYSFSLSVPDKFLFFTRFKASVAEDVSGPPLPVGVFTHVVATYEATKLAIWVNGELAGSATSGATLADTTNHLTIGGGRGGVFCYFRGALDEVAIYPTVLSVARIKAHHQAGITK